MPILSQEELYVTKNMRIFTFIKKKVGAIPCSVFGALEIRPVHIFFNANFELGLHRRVWKASYGLSPPLGL